MCNIVLSWRVKCTGHEIDHFCQPNVEVKNEGCNLCSLCMPLWHGQGQLDLYHGLCMEGLRKTNSFSHNNHS